MATAVKHLHPESGPSEIRRPVSGDDQTSPCPCRALRTWRGLRRDWTPPMRGAISACIPAPRMSFWQPYSAHCGQFSSPLSITHDLTGQPVSTSRTFSAIPPSQRICLGRDSKPEVPVPPAAQDLLLDGSPSTLARDGGHKSRR